MFRIGCYTGRVYEAEKFSAKDIRECAAVIQTDLSEFSGSLEATASQLHERCKNCLGCEEAKRDKR